MNVGLWTTKSPYQNRVPPIPMVFFMFPVKMAICFDVPYFQTKLCMMFTWLVGALEHEF